MRHFFSDEYIIMSLFLSLGNSSSQIMNHFLCQNCCLKENTMYLPFVVGTKRTELFIVSWLRLHVAIRTIEIFHFIHIRPWTSSLCQQQKKDLYVSRQRVTNALPSARQKGYHPSLISRRHCDQSCIDQINSVKNEKGARWLLT